MREDQKRLRKGKDGNLKYVEAMKARLEGCLRERKVERKKIWTAE